MSQGNAMLPTSKLEAINEMLSCVGEAPVNRLRSGNVQAEIAENILESTLRTLQVSGWNFNTDNKVTIQPDSAGHLRLPANTLKADATNTTTDNGWVMRNAKMYNKTTNTYITEQTLEVDLVLLLPFEELPEAARQYATLRAGRLLQDRTMGVGHLHQFNMQDEHNALVELRDMDAAVNDFTIFDSFDTYQIINRTGGRVR
jgi:hypothetical protein